ncbi:MAG: hypothetical protein Q8R54_02880 [Methylobacter sp.]|nr:hypothetical protein [Methylobacter sp.]
MKFKCLPLSMPHGFGRIPYKASSLDEACEVQGFVTPTIPYSATLHTGYVSKLPVTNDKVTARKISY